MQGTSLVTAGALSSSGPHFSGKEVVLLDGPTIWVELHELLFRLNVRGSKVLLFVLADQVGHRNQDREETREFTLARSNCYRDIR